MYIRIVGNMCIVSSYQLSFSDQPLTFADQLYLCEPKNNVTLQLYGLHDGRLHIYHYDGGTWQVFPVENIDVQQFYCANNVLGALVTKGRGIYVFQFQNNRFNTSRIRGLSIFGWNKPGNVIKFGHFYLENSFFDILTQNQRNGVNLYSVRKDERQTGKHRTFLLSGTESIFGNSSQTEFFLADLRQKGQENIITYGRDGLRVYEFNQNNTLECLLQAPHITKLCDSSGKLFFPNLTGQSYQDIVLLDPRGLFVYQYNSEENSYRLIHYNPSFAKVKGWNAQYVNSIQFEDIDLDGRQDMLFTGPRGINLLSFNNYTNQLQSLLNNSQLSIAQRHNNVIKVIPANPPITEHPIVFTQYKNQLHWANITEVEKLFEEELHEEIEPPVVNQTSSMPPITPQLARFQFEEEKPVLLLRDQLDCSSIIGAVDSNTGKPRFELPLIDLSSPLANIKLSFNYDGNSKLSDILGLGWSFPQNFIALDHRSSIFPEDEKYYVILGGLPQEITFDSANSTDDIYFFKLLKDQPGLQIRYHKNEERWEIGKAAIKQIYGHAEGTGGNVDPISWQLTWENWRGIGSSTTGQKQLATAWYLAGVRDKNDNAVHYTYDVVNIPVSSGTSFTREIYLKTINDSQGNRIVFRHSDRDESEYDLPPLVDKKNKFFNTQKVQTRYLRGYTVTTPSYQQNINFVYEIESGKRFLTKIEQVNDITGQPILQFKYKKISKSHVLEKVILPTGAGIEFSYQTHGEEHPITGAEEREIEYGGRDYRVDYGGDEILISYLNERGKIALRMFDQDMKKELYSSDNLQGLSFLGSNIIKQYEVVNREDFFAVILQYNTDKDLCLFHKQKGDSVSDPEFYRFGKDSIIRFGKDFIVVANDHFSVQVISWSKDSQQWMEREIFPRSETPVLLAAFSRMFLVYRDDFLSLGYKDNSNKWKIKGIKKISGVINDIKGTLDKFDLDDETHNQLLNHFKNTALQLNNNLIALSRWKAEEEQLYSLVDLFTLNSRYEIVHGQQYRVTQDNMSQFPHEMKDKKGNTFILRYESVDNKFKVVFKDFHGPIRDECDKNQIDGCFGQVREMLLGSKKPFLLNPRKYHTILKQQTAVCNNKKFTFVGCGWEEETLSEEELKQEKLSIPLDNKLILDKESAQSSLKLYHQGENREKFGNRLLDLGVQHLNQTLIRYPVYLAYQENGKPVNIAEFSSDGSSIKRNYSLPIGEMLSPWSSYQTLITTQSGMLIFRPNMAIKQLLSPVVSKVTVNLDDGSKRTTGYKYGSARALGNAVYYEKTSVIPGNDKASFGWIEEIRDFRNQSKAEKKIFNSQRELIKTVEFQEEQINAVVDEEDLYLNTTLLDKTGKLEVAQFFPYEIGDEEVGYYGFEDYEVNSIGTGSEKKWLFNEASVVKQNFSFTGQNYLSLSGQMLSGTFQPKDQNQRYVASCWMRPQGEIFKVGAVTPCLKATVSTESGDEVFKLLSRIKFQFGNWFYSEVIVDLPYAEQFYKALNAQTNTTTIEQPDVNLKVSVSIGPGVNTTIDVDHVRFSPLSSNFQANVYDPKTKQITDVINDNGLVKRYVHDRYQEQVASVNEYNQLEEFYTYAKASSIDKITQLRSRTLIQPSGGGFYENFSPSSFNTLWKIDDANAWQISPGLLQHLNDDIHNLQLNSDDLSSTSYGIRLCFSLQSENARVKFGNGLQITRTNDSANIAFLDSRNRVLLDGEILIVVEHSRLLVWVDGGLYIDQVSPLVSNRGFSPLEFEGKVGISGLMIFNNPSVLVTYFNALGEKLQEISLESENTVIVRACLQRK